MAAGTTNRFSERLRGGGCQIGIWLSCASTTVTEIAAGAGFDFAVIDTEHSPNSLTDVLDQLRVLRSLDVDAIVRPAANDPIEIRRFLDIGAQTLLIPMVHTAAAARDAVAAARYPPHGIRGVSMAHRANAYGRNRSYLGTAGADICIIPQIETRQAVANLDDILAVDGVTAIFVGPADLSADMGHLGQPDHPQIDAVLASVSSKAEAAGKRFGTLVAGAERARARRNIGAGFVAAATDIGLLRQTTDDLVAALGTFGARK